LSVFKKLTVPDQKQYAFTGTFAGGETFLHWFFARMHGATFWDFPNKNGLTFNWVADKAPNANAMLNVLQFYQESIQAGLLPPGYIQTAGGADRTEFVAGLTSVVLNANANTAIQLLANAGGIWKDNATTSPMWVDSPPLLDNYGGRFDNQALSGAGHAIVPSTANGAWIFNQAEGGRNPDAMWEFIKIFCGFPQSLYRTLTAGRGPFRSDLWAYVKGDPWWDAWSPIYQNYNYLEWAFYSYGCSQLMGTAWGNFNAQFWKDGTMTPEAGLAYWTDQVQQQTATLPPAPTGTTTTNTTSTTTSTSSSTH
jgi:hypothetical protein